MRVRRGCTRIPRGCRIHTSRHAQLDGYVAARVGVGGASQPGFLNNPRFLASKDTRRAVLMVNNDPVETTPKLWDDPTLSQTLKLEWEPGATDVEVNAHATVHQPPSLDPVSSQLLHTHPVTHISACRSVGRTLTQP